MNLCRCKRAGPLLLILGLIGCTEPAPVQPEITPEASKTSGTPQVKLTHTGSGASVFDIATEDPALRKLSLPSGASAAYYRALPIGVLQARAKVGEKMAKAFLVERLAMQDITLQRTRSITGKLPEGIEDGDLVGDLGQIGLNIAPLLRDPNNAMAGYLWGQQLSAATYGAPHEPIVAGIRLAALRGDFRASEFERQYMAKYPNLDSGKIQMYFASGRLEMEGAELRTD